MSRSTRTVDVLSAILLVVCGAALAVPKYQTMQRAETAAALLDDVEHVRKAVYAFYSDSAYFPPEVAGGELPDPLMGYLPRGFAARRPYGMLRYRNWAVRAPDTASVLVDSSRVAAPMDTLATAPDSLLQEADSVQRAAPADAASAAAADSARALLDSLSRTTAERPREVLRTNVIAVVVAPTDIRVGEAAYRRARRLAAFVVGDRYAFVIFGG